MRQQEVNMKISTEVIIALLASFAISVVLSPIIIPFLKRLKIGQTERTEGVQSHLEKAGTPTMGGLIILISVLVTSLFFVRRYPNIIPVLFLTLGFGIIGFLDDYLKLCFEDPTVCFRSRKCSDRSLLRPFFWRIS